jgi:hypothetical protein
MAWKQKVKWILIGLTVVSLSIAIYFIFSGDEKKQQLQDLTKWSILKKTEILNGIIEKEETKIGLEDTKILDLKNQIKKVQDARHEISNKDEAKLSNRELASAWDDVLHSFN